MRKRAFWWCFNWPFFQNKSTIQHLDTNPDLTAQLKTDPYGSGFGSEYATHILLVNITILPYLLNIVFLILKCLDCMAARHEHEKEQQLRALPGSFLEQDASLDPGYYQGCKYSKLNFGDRRKFNNFAFLLLACLKKSQNQQTIFSFLHPVRR